MADPIVTKRKNFDTGVLRLNRYKNKLQINALQNITTNTSINKVNKNMPTNTSIKNGKQKYNNKHYKNKCKQNTQTTVMIQ